MLACANCLQAKVYDVMELQAGSIMHANTPMCQLVQAVTKGLPTRACSNRLQALVHTACKGSLKLPARACSKCLPGLAEIACKGLFRPARLSSNFFKLPARVCPPSLALRLLYPVQICFSGYCE